MIYIGNEEALKQAVVLLKESGLPEGLLPLEDATEMGHVKETGYMWIQQKKKVQHEFNKLVSYDVQITSFVEFACIKKLKGMEAKELMLRPPVGEITVDQSSGKIHLKSFAGVNHQDVPRRGFHNRGIH